uniref:N/A n=1 Tax=Ganoderma boninense TaxID=34458 RepID=A0A5K1K6F3_9APHY|nr:N/A [Ganoderma boninense]
MISTAGGEVDLKAAAEVILVSDLTTARSVLCNGFSRGQYERRHERRDLDGVSQLRRCISMRRQRWDGKSPYSALRVAFTEPARTWHGNAFDGTPWFYAVGSDTRYPDKQPSF